MEDKLKKAQKDAKEKPGDKQSSASTKEAAAEIARLKKEMPAQPAVGPRGQRQWSGDEGLYPRQPRQQRGGKPPKGFPRVLPCSTPPGDDYSRLDLANAIASKDNPLTARVIVNRIWSWHFGRGLVATPSNFG